MSADPTSRLHGGNEHSTSAAASIDKAALRARVLAVITAAGYEGMTSDEAEAATGLSHQTVSARMVELKKVAAIQPAGRRRTRSGRTAGVWCAAPTQGVLFGGAA